MSLLIPVVNQSGQIVQRLSLAQAEALKGVELVRARGGSGRVVRVKLKPVTNQVCELTDRSGRHIQQRLPDSGRVVHALYGVAGSEPESKPIYCRRCDEVHRGACPVSDDAAD